MGVELGQGCVVCGPDEGFEEFKIDEGMFRTGERFTYRQCKRCGSLQIAEMPADLAPYYNNSQYYSFKPLLSRPALETKVGRAALTLNAAMYVRTGLGRGMPWTREAGMRVNDRILELGSGSGNLLLRMHRHGFRQLTGSDPFVDEPKEIAPGLELKKAFHHEVTGEYDWIMMHHSFEHVPDPHSTLRSCRRLLADGGRVLIRMPIMGQAAWRIYGVNWVQIDPPRHLVLYTPMAVREIAEAEGFKLERIFFDSSAFQFWGSELVASGRPHANGKGNFTERERAEWEAEAVRLNRSNDGDAGGYVLSPA